MFDSKHLGSECSTYRHAGIMALNHWAPYHGCSPSWMDFQADYSLHYGGTMLRRIFEMREKSLFVAHARKFASYCLPHNGPNLRTIKSLSCGRAEVGNDTAARYLARGDKTHTVDLWREKMGLHT